MSQKAAREPMEWGGIFFRNPAQPLQGQRVYIDGLERTMVDVLVKVSYLNGEKTSFMLKPDANLGTFPTTADKLSVVKAYTILCIKHIWFGIDSLYNR